MGMKTEDIKAELRSIADSLPPGASYVDAIYELYVRMKAAEGKKAAEENRGEKGISPITHKVPNHWVETDAADRASHPKRYTDGEFSTRTVECIGGLQLRVGPGKGRSKSQQARRFVPRGSHGFR